MGFDFNPLFWFTCRSCDQAFPDIDRFKTHKIKCHLGECLTTKCIIFKEINPGDGWAPSNAYSKGKGRVDGKLDSKNEAVCPKTNFQSSRVKPAFPLRNPYVSLRLLTSEELKSKSFSIGRRACVSGSATRKRPAVFEEAETAKRSSRLTSSVSDIKTNANGTAVLTDDNVSFRWNADGYSVPDTIKSFIPEHELIPKIESESCSEDGNDFTEDGNDFTEEGNDSTEDPLDDPTNYEVQTETCATDSFNDSSGFGLDVDRSSTPDFTSLQESTVVPLANSDIHMVNQNSSVVCIMCETQLRTKAEEENHLDNCWLHNKSRHIYCILCNRKFKHPLQLKKHQQNRHNDATNENQSVGTSLIPTVFEVSDDEDDISENFNLDTLPLDEWIQKRRERLPDLILLHPDPTDPTCLLRNDTKLTCKLCTAKFRSDTVKDHLKTCWAYNKQKHVYCDLCQKSYTERDRFRSHNRMFHPFKPLPLPSIFCSVCHEEFQSFSELREHSASMTKFFQVMTAKETFLVR